MKQLLALLIVAGLVACFPALATAQDNSSPRGNPNALVLPTGTEIAIRTDEAIDSKTARAGQTFNGQVAQDVMGGAGEVLIPKGSEATLTLRQVSSGGTTGSADLRSSGTLYLPN